MERFWAPTRAHVHFLTSVPSYEAAFTLPGLNLYLNNSGRKLEIPFTVHSLSTDLMTTSTQHILHFIHIATNHGQHILSHTPHVKLTFITPFFKPSYPKLPLFYICYLIFSTFYYLRCKLFHINLYIRRTYNLGVILKCALYQLLINSITCT